MSEVKDIMVTIDVSESASNLWGNLAAKLKSKDKELKHPIEFDFIGIKNLFANRGLMEDKHNYSVESRYKEDVLVPNINDEGQVKGSYMMYFMTAWEMDEVTIKKEKEKYKDSFKEKKDDEEMRY